MEVAGVVRAAEGAFGGVAEHHAHGGGGPALQLAEEPAVEAELQDVAGLGVAGELGVQHFVAVSAKCRGFGHAAQEVGAAEPAGEAQGGLEDHRGAGAEGGEGLFDLLCSRGGAWDFHEIRMGGAQAREVLLFPGVALLLQEKELGVVFGTGERGCEVLEVEDGEVGAGEVVDDVASRHYQVLVAPEHSLLRNGISVCPDRLRR